MLADQWGSREQPRHLLTVFHSNKLQINLKPESLVTPHITVKYPVFAYQPREHAVRAMALLGKRG